MAWLCIFDGKVQRYDCFESGKAGRLLFNAGQARKKNVLIDEAVLEPKTVYPLCITFDLDRRYCKRILGVSRSVFCGYQSSNLHRDSSPTLLLVLE
jgi:hypothetical protein